MYLGQRGGWIRIAAVAWQYCVCPWYPLYTHTIIERYEIRHPQFGLGLFNGCSHVRMSCEGTRRTVGGDLSAELLQK
jgi:hypothetical protein